MLRNPAWVLSATGHSTEWISTKTRLPVPRPNQIIASGNKAEQRRKVAELMDVLSRAAR